MNNEDYDRESVYLSIQPTKESKVVIPFKNVLGDLHSHYDGNTISESTKTAMLTSFNQFKKESVPTVNYLVKEFEMKKAADAHQRTSISKSGVLDTNKMHAYKVTDDIFRRMETIRDGKNHGLLMYVDWSGSMSDNIFGTIKQTLNLVMFARKVGIPFEVYAFSNQTGLGESPWNYSEFNEPAFIGRNFNLIQFFHHRMNTKQFNTMCKYFYYTGIALGNVTLSSLSYYDYIYAPNGYGLGSTPLNEAIFTAIDQVERFKGETGADKIHTIFLTDGDSDGNRSYYNPNKEGSYKEESFYRKDIYLRDPITKITRKMDEWKLTELTDTLLMFLRERTGAEAIGFFILPNLKAMQRWKSWDSIDSGRKEMRQHGFTTADGTGYSDFYLIKGGKALDTDANELEIDPTAKRGAMTTAFRKFSKSKRVNKVLLSRFVDMVA